MTYPIFKTVSEVLGLEWRQALPFHSYLKFAGIYLLIHPGKLYPYDYVGKSSSVGWRLVHGHHAVYQPGLHRVWLLEEKNIDMRDYLESEFIRVLNPNQNKIRGHVPDCVLSDKEHILKTIDSLDFPY